MTTPDSASTLTALFTDSARDMDPGLSRASRAIGATLDELSRDLAGRLGPDAVRCELVPSSDLGRTGGPTPAPLGEGDMTLVARAPDQDGRYQAILVRTASLDEAATARLLAWREQAATLWASATSPALFQYWNRIERPEEVDALMRDWAADPAFRYTAHTRETALAMIGRWLPERAAAAFVRCNVPAMQADLFRLCAMYVFGGIYIDADIENLHRNDVLLHRKGRGFLFHRHGSVANDVMVVHTPGDPLLHYCLWKAVANIEEGRLDNVWKMTGPGILTSAYKRVGAEDPLFLGFRFGEARDLRKMLGFHWKLAYKRTDDHWRRLAADRLVAPGEQPAASPET